MNPQAEKEPREKVRLAANLFYLVPNMLPRRNSITAALKPGLIHLWHWKLDRACRVQRSASLQISASETSTAFLFGRTGILRPGKKKNRAREFDCFCITDFLGERFRVSERRRTKNDFRQRRYSRGTNQTRWPKSQHSQKSERELFTEEHRGTSSSQCLARGGQTSGKLRANVGQRRPRVNGRREERRKYTSWSSLSIRGEKLIC